MVLSWWAKLLRTRRYSKASRYGHWELENTSHESSEQWRAQPREVGNKSTESRGAVSGGSATLFQWNSLHRGNFASIPLRAGLELPMWPRLASLAPTLSSLASYVLRITGVSTVSSFNMCTRDFRVEHGWESWRMALQTKLFKLGIVVNSLFLSWLFLPASMINLQSDINRQAIAWTGVWRRPRVCLL